MAGEWLPLNFKNFSNFGNSFACINLRNLRILKNMHANISLCMREINTAPDFSKMAKITKKLTPDFEKKGLSKSRRPKIN